MPTVTFTHSDTPPDAVPSAWQEPSNVAPAGVPAEAMAGTAALPVAVALSSMAQSDTPPDDVPLGSFDPAGGAPAAVASASMDPVGAAPVGIALSDMAGTPAAPVAVALDSMAPAGEAPAAIALADMTGTSDVPQPVAFSPIIPDPSDSNMHTAALNFVGQLTLDQVFGFYKAPTTASIKGVQLSAQTAPTGADVIIELVDSAGVSLGRTATLPAGEVYADVQFAEPLNVLGAAIVRAKVTQIGSVTPGGYLTANLIVQLL